MGRVAPLVAAGTAWVSLNPYFFWGSSRPLLVASLLAGAVSAILYAQGVRPRWRGPEFAGVLLLSIFLIYVTALPRVDGGHVKWVFVLPTLWLLALLDVERRRRSMEVFATIFVVTLLPGLAVSILAIGGVPLTFETIPAANALMAAAGTRMLVLPGVLFFESNSLVLPWGGVLFRFCGMYDEPGMVGTMAALLLAAHQYYFRQWRVAILYLAGLLSFSLAFAILTTLGLLAHAALRPRLLAATPLVPVLAAASLATGAWSLSVPPGTESAITIVDVTSPHRESSSPEKERSRRLVAGAELRQTGWLNNRSLPLMEALVAHYGGGGPRIWLFGLGSDASVVRGGVSQTWKRLLTDYGAIGFALLVAGLALIAWSRVQASRTAWVAVFLALYALSIYQRPVVWMPYALLILLCGSVVVGGPAQESPRLRRAGPLPHARRTPALRCARGVPDHL
jgi:hypothetical protein